MRTTRHESYERIYAVVRRIPRGRVATYGQVAELAGLGGHARQVGYALHRSPGADYLQRSLLEGEGLHFDERERIDLDRYRWRPRRSRMTP